MKGIKKRIGLILGVMMILLLCGCDRDEKKVTIGTGGEGGTYYSYASNLSLMVKDSKDISMEVKATAGSAANLRLLSQGYLDMALVQSDTLAMALNGEGSFSGNPIHIIHSVTGLYTESCQIVIPKASGFESVEDLKGKRVSVGEKDSGVLKNAEDILKAYGMSFDDIQVEYDSFEEAAEELKKGNIDAFFCTAGSPTTAIVKLNEDMPIRVLNIDGDATKRLLNENPAYTESVILADTYAGLDQDIHTIGVSAVLVARDDIDPEKEAAILSVLQENNDNLISISFGEKAPETKKDTFTVALDMYTTLALAVLVLYLGGYLRKRVKFLETFCIPAPVVGGLLFAVVSCVLYVTGIIEFNFDETLKTVCMIIFFTSVGFQANLKVLKKGGVSLVVFLLCVVVLIVSQNALAVGMSKLLNISPFIGLCTGSIPMVGGHGTAGAFGLVLEDLGLSEATTLCTAAATFGLIMGSLMGGPIGRRLIIKHDLLKTIKKEDASVLIEDEVKHHRKTSMYAPAAYQIAIAMGMGTIVSMLLSKTGMTFPIYIGAMIVAAVMRNVGEYSGKFTIHMGEINDIGGICLSMFLGIAMVTLKLWQLADLALPLFILLLVQTILMFLFAYFVVFNIMGRNYDAAVLSAGTCGFGMGATPNAMANMQALTEKYEPSVQAYLLVPIVGSMFADFINSLVITFFINLL